MLDLGERDDLQHEGPKQRCNIDDGHGQEEQSRKGHRSARRVKPILDGVAASEVKGALNANAARPKSKRDGIAQYALYARNPYQPPPT